MKLLKKVPGFFSWFGGGGASEFARFNGDSARLVYENRSSPFAQPGGTKMLSAWTMKLSQADIDAAGNKVIWLLDYFTTHKAGRCYVSGTNLTFQMGTTGGSSAVNVTYIGVLAADVEQQCVIIYDQANVLQEDINPALYINGQRINLGVPVGDNAPYNYSYRISVGGNSFTGDGFRGSLKDVYLNQDSLPPVALESERLALVAKFYANGAAKVLGDGIAVTGVQPLLCVSGGPNDWNYGNVSSSLTLNPWIMHGRGVDYDREVNKIAWRKPIWTLDAELGVTVAGDGALDVSPGSNYQLPYILGNSVRLANSAAATPESLVITSVSFPATLAFDEDLPIWALFWGNNFTISAGAFITLKISAEAGALVNYTEYRYDMLSAGQRGFFALPIIPYFAQVAVTPGSGYLPKTSSITKFNNGWVKPGVERIEIEFTNFESVRKSTTPGNAAVFAFQGLVQGYGHTPTVLITADDGQNSLESVDNAGAENTFEIMGGHTSNGIYPDGIPLTVSLIDGGTNSRGGLLTDAQLDIAEGICDLGYSVHGPRNLSGNLVHDRILALDCTITSPFTYNEDIIQVGGTGEGRFLGVIPGGMLMFYDTAITPFEDPATVLTITGATGVATHVTGQVPRFATAAELAVDLTYNQNMMVSSRGAGHGTYDYVYPLGSYRNGTQTVNSTVSQAMELAGMRSGAYTLGGSSTTFPFDLADWGDGFSEKMSVYRFSLEDVGECTLATDITTKRFAITLRELGGGIYTYFHAPKIVGSVRGDPVQPNIPIEDLETIFTYLNAQRELGWVKTLKVKDYFDAIDARIPRGVTDPVSFPPYPDYRLTRYEINQSNAILGTVTREYYVYTPSDYVPGIEKPVVISFHGGGGNAMSQWDLARQDLVSEYFKANGDDSFILVLPSGYDTHWNAAPGEQYECSQVNIDDVGFIQSMMTAVGAIYSVDTTRFYATGMSNGSRFLQRMALDAPDFFAAIAGVGGGLSQRIVNGWDEVADHDTLVATEPTYIGHASQSANWNGRGSYIPYFLPAIVLSDLSPTPIRREHGIADGYSLFNGYSGPVYDNKAHQLSFNAERDFWLSVNEELGATMTNAGTVLLDAIASPEAVDAGRDAPNPGTVGLGDTSWNIRTYNTGDTGNLNMASEMEYVWGDENALAGSGHTWSQGLQYLNIGAPWFIGYTSQEFNSGIESYRFMRRFIRT